MQIKEYKDEIVVQYEKSFNLNRRPMKSTVTKRFKYEDLGQVNDCILEAVTHEKPKDYHIWLNNKPVTRDGLKHYMEQVIIIDGLLTASRELAK